VQGLFSLQHLLQFSLLQKSIHQSEQVPPLAQGLPIEKRPRLFRSRSQFGINIATGTSTACHPGFILFMFISCASTACETLFQAKAADILLKNQLAVKASYYEQIPHP
jgi:hypothetical protein